ncbi:Protein of unknown function [Nocardioides terrae]|uniref:DUF2877 domain-containing protein n=1 Tax=Nocardioides terrae TaxID=574651 RepID=A0A1I1DJD8_9ACTN|nr:DUF2877 domain-containing protein [Nocardioides terrae]SFB74556.1 Protein of unknown function [Nocardioides terrae]
MKPPTRLPAAASRRVRDRIGSAPDGPLPVLHRGPHALYLDLAGRCLGVVDRLAAQVPCALRVTSLTGLESASATVVAGVLHLDGSPLPIGRIVDVAVPRIPAAGRAEQPSAARVAELVGSGTGLTPYGDDVLCGWLAMHRAAGVQTPAVDAAVRSLLHRTTLLSATLLDCALHGEVLPEFADWVRALGTSDEAAATAALEGIGHTSGRGLLTGARRALATLRVPVPA